MRVPLALIDELVAKVRRLCRRDQSPRTETS